MIDYFVPYIVILTIKSGCGFFLLQKLVGDATRMCYPDRPTADIPHRAFSTSDAKQALKLAEDIYGKAQKFLVRYLYAFCE